MPSEKVSTELLRGFLKATLVHRHAFVGSARETALIGRGGRLPESLKALLREPAAAAAAGVKKLFGAAGSGKFLLEGLLDRYAHPKGIADLKASAGARPSFWPAWVWLGLALLRRCEFEGARAVLDELVRLRPDWSWSYLLRGELGRVGIEYQSSLRDHDRALALDPENAWAWAFRSRVRFQAGPDREALRDLDRAVALSPKEGWLRAWRGDARRKLGDLKGAREDLAAALKSEPSYDRTYLWLGKVLESAGDLKGARRVLTEGLRRCPYFEKALAQRASVHKRLGKVPEAIQDLNRAAAINHRHGWLGSWTVEPAPLRPDQRAALDVLESYADRHPKAAWALAWRGEARSQVGNLFDALSDLDRALALRPLAWVLAWKGEVLAKMGKAPEALRVLNRAAALDPSYGRTRAWKGRVLFLLGRPAEAIARARQVNKT